MNRSEQSLGATRFGSPKKGNIVATGQAPKKKKRKADRLIGTVIADKYKIIKKIGEGGMGSVYTANQEPIDRMVAIKVLLGRLADDEVAVKRFEQEARAISKMQHPNTVTIYDFGRTNDTEDGMFYIVMEYLKGRTLTQLLRKQGTLEETRAARIVRQVCASLSDAHQAGIIHRDLKPDNIFLTEVGGDKDWVKVLDFGVAKLADAEGAGTLTQTGMIFGTPKYMSPEQAEGRPIDYRADIYAMGVVLYELLTGKPPFLADTPVGLLLKHISTPPMPFKEMRPDLTIDPHLEAIVMKSLDKVPDRRQQTIQQLSDELAAFERAVSGMIQVAPGATGPSMVAGTPAGGTPGMPTEVNPAGTDQPARPGSRITPSGLKPPGSVPSDLSLTPPGGQSQAMTQAQGGASSASGATAAATGGALLQSHTQHQTQQQTQGAAGMTAPGLTHPVGVAGGGVETLGGEISRGLAPPPKPKSRAMLIGIGMLMLAVGAVVFIQSQPEVIPVAQPLPGKPEGTEPPKTPEQNVAMVEAKTPTEPPPKAPPPEAPPVKAPTRRPVRRSPPPPPAKPTKVTVKFKSSPSKVLVTLEGKQIGFTPFERDFVADGDLLTFEFTKKGYKSKKAVRPMSQDRTLSVTLKQVEVAKAPPPKAPPPRAPPKVKRCKDGTLPPCKRIEVSTTKRDPLNDRVDELKD